MKHLKNNTFISLMNYVRDTINFHWNFCLFE